MIGQLAKITILDLWGEKKVEFDLDKKNLILVGENGSGKTTILRMLYEVLACRWSQLSTEDFSSIKILFSDNSCVEIEKEKILVAQKLIVNSHSELFGDLPMVVRRHLSERSNISGRDISYDLILEMLDEYDYSDSQIYAQIKEKIDEVESEMLSEYTKAIKDKIDFNIMYLPTYRRVEKRLGYVNERGYSRRPINARVREFGYLEDQSIEIAKTGMDDVEFFIQRSLENIKRKADISASRLNYQCFKGILSKISDSVEFNEDILSKESIENVFGSINENVLSAEESEQIKDQLVRIKKSAPKRQTYDQIVYYFYSMLYDRYQQLRENERGILNFFDACNGYLVNKKFEYDEKEYSYNIYVDKGEKKREIKLEQLSSGEKQVVSIFSYLYLSPFAKSLILIDEPELSLSVPWQKRFLLDLANGSQCAGVISVTHSPFVFDNDLKKCAHALEEFVK
ncbi:MAG: ATP-binding cassette domain-containing protein [Ruminococcaceae bacterium]|nr:ATP-binding cassette domain-containing protein [Oscillospiraceae bacterium]